MKPRGDGGAADGRMPAQLGSCAGIAVSGPARPRATPTDLTRGPRSRTSLSDTAEAPARPGAPARDTTP